MKIETLTSGIWQTNTTILSARGRCIVVDPAYFPRELDAIAARIREIGSADAVLFTHGHWDHVMGHSVAPGAPVWVSQVLAGAVRARDAKTMRYLDDAREFDSRWYIPRSGHRWPDVLHGIAEGPLDLAGTPARALHLPGHSPEGLGIVVEGTLLAGDYLSPCEIPFVDDAIAYRATLLRLLELVPALAEVIPGHGPRLTANEAVAIARADLAYLDELIAAPSVDAALAVPLPRAADVVGMRDHHRDNATRRHTGDAGVPSGA